MQDSTERMPGLWHHTPGFLKNQSVLATNMHFGDIPNKKIYLDGEYAGELLVKKGLLGLK